MQLAVVDDYEVIVMGVAAMLAPYEHVIEIKELDANEPLTAQVDVALYDTFAQGEAHRHEVQVLLDDPRAERVAIYTWNFAPFLIEAAVRRGVAGYLSKTLTGAELAEALVRIHAGEQVISPPPGHGARNRGGRNWPGRNLGLSERESELLALITQGCGNPDIADMLHLSPNSIKSHTRNLYRKIGVTNRTQAALWGVAHDFLPPHTPTPRGVQTS
ncbi:MAG: DNA-binding response regulator [Acidimicrobiia bacterium]